MSKTKSSTKATKPEKADILGKVKDAAVAKPVKSIKTKSKELAKAVVGKKEDKSKSKKKAREPSPESSESEADSESSESSSSESESESEDEKTTKTTLKAAKAKTNGASHAVNESDASSDESSEDEAPAPKVKLASNVKAVEKESDDDSSASDEASSDSSDDEKPAKKFDAKADAKKAVTKDQSDSDSESSDSDADSSEDEEEDESEEVKPKSVKRKADEEAEPAAKKTKVAESSNAQSANLFVGNLSWNVDDAWLKETFEEFGEISRAQLMTDRATGRSKGFGYVEFVNAEDAAKAHQAKQGAELDGRAMNVDFANAKPNNQDRQDDRRKSYGDQVSQPSDTLFLGNLSFDVGQEAVTEAFSPHGTVLGIRLPTDRETGQPKGFGYVTFSSVEEAQAALEAMQGGYIGGRPVRLDYSQPRPQNGDSPSRGRGGFGGRGGGRGGRGSFGGRGGRGGSGGGFGGRGGGRGGSRGGSTNRGGFGDFSGRKVSFD